MSKTPLLVRKKEWIQMYRLNHCIAFYVLIFAQIRCVCLMWWKLQLDPSVDKYLCATALAIQLSVITPV